MTRGRIRTVVPLIVLAALAASCGGAASPSTAPAATVAAPASTSAPASPSPSASPSPAVETAAAVATASPSAAASPAASTSAAKPRPTFDTKALTASFTGKITLLNLADSDLAVTITYIDPSNGQSWSLGAYSIPSFAQQTNALPPASYRLDFRQPAGAATGPKCTIVVAKGQSYSFAAVPGAIAVSRIGYTPKTAKDLFVATSSLCKK